MKHKGFSMAKETINKTKKQPTEWEKIFANHSSLITDRTSAPSVEALSLNHCTARGVPVIHAYGLTSRERGEKELKKRLPI